MKPSIGPVVQGLALIGISNLIGHYMGPFSLLATLVLPFFIITVINYKLYKKNFPGTVIYGYGIILLNDLLLRLYAGGTHDQAGMAWISLMSFFAFVFSTGSMLLFAIRMPRTAEQQNLFRRRLQNIGLVAVCGIVTVIFYSSVLIDK